MPAHVSTGYIYVSEPFYNSHLTVFCFTVACISMYKCCLITSSQLMSRFGFEVCGFPTAQAIGQWSIQEQFARDLDLALMLPTSWGLATMWVVPFFISCVINTYRQSHQGWIWQVVLSAKYQFYCKTFKHTIETTFSYPGCQSAGKGLSCWKILQHCPSHMQHSTACNFHFLVNMASFTFRLLFASHSEFRSNCLSQWAVAVYYQCIIVS